MSPYLKCFMCAFCGAFASVVGKYALDTSYTLVIVNFLLRLLPLPTCQTIDSSDAPPFQLACTSIVFYVIRVGLIGFMLFVNSVMLNLLVKSMHTLGTARATSIINSLSFCLSGVMGMLIFSEKINLQWCCGVAVILAGVLLIARSTPEEKTEKKE
eukprot:TRINITY_DN16954_c0_g1_i1.p1 TRINITY_DN16954_c0_g1~~TRINITY_DN16954_c0_g1_i1.p1  ORF type:complete len:156 (+),score=17.74 TRINITY_DN16954_c0_g1_i1:77-544(+)